MSLNINPKWLPLSFAAAVISTNAIYLSCWASKCLIILLVWIILWIRQQKRKSKPRTRQKGRKADAQYVVDTCNVKVKDKIMQFEALVEEAVGTTVESQDINRQHSIVVSEAEDALQPCTSNRNSILSNSSVESGRSDSTIDPNIQLGSSIFYVVWD